MALRAGELARAMIGAAKASLARNWKQVRDYAEPEFRRLAASLVSIVQLAAEGKLSKREAEALLTIHRNTTRTVMLTVEGMGLLAVEGAINAALAAVAEAVNGALPFKLL